MEDETDCNALANDADVESMELAIICKLLETALSPTFIEFAREEETNEILLSKEAVAEFRLFCIVTIDAAADAEF